MKRITAFNLILILLICNLLILPNISNAIDMNLPDSEIEYTNNSPITFEDNNTSSDSNETTNSPTSSSSSNQTNNDFFTAENILSIFLITIGIVLILLAIAIFIRLK